MNNTQIEKFENVILRAWKSHDDFIRQYDQTGKQVYIDSALDVLDSIDCFDYSLDILGYQYDRILGTYGETINIKVRKKVL